MHSVCHDCKYFSLDGCAVQPGYWAALKHLQRCDQKFKAQIAPMLAPCPEFHPAETKTLNLTLPESWWIPAVDANCPSDFSRIILYRIEMQIREHLKLPPNPDRDPTKYTVDDIPF